MIYTLEQVQEVTTATALRAVKEHLEIQNEELEEGISMYEEDRRGNDCSENFHRLTGAIASARTMIRVNDTRIELLKEALR